MLERKIHFSIMAPDDNAHTEEAITVSVNIFYDSIAGQMGFEIIDFTLHMGHKSPAQIWHSADRGLRLYISYLVSRVCTPDYLAAIRDSDAFDDVPNFDDDEPSNVIRLGAL